MGFVEEYWQSAHRNIQIFLPMNILSIYVFNNKTSLCVKVVIHTLCSILIFITTCAAQIQEPYSPLHGGSYRGPFIRESPDPLVRYHWKRPKASDSLEIYTLSPKKITGTPDSSFHISPEGITVSGAGDLMFDFGAESAGWLEFDADDLEDSVTASISEYNEPAIVNAGAVHRIKTLAPIKYGHTYRLELNKALYEGVRFAWIHVKTVSRPWHLKNVRLVCQIRPTNYQGSFSCSDPKLTRIWYTGAYTVKLNLLQDYFGAILMERSDRHSWTGDAYPAQAAALAAFGNVDMVRKNLAYTSNQNNGIAAYSMYWVLSLIDYYNYTGDSAFLRKYVGNANMRLEKAFRGYDHLPPLHFMGWDERLGAGFENPQIQEAQDTYKMLCIQAWRAFAGAMASIDKNELAARYERIAARKIHEMEYNEKEVIRFGIHALSRAINAGLGGDSLVERLSRMAFNDRLQRLSYSPFNQFFIIQAMAKAGQYEDALVTVRDCWGGQIDYGGTSFFEVYRPSWNAMLKPNDPPPNNQCGYTSLCHPWSAGVTQWLSENVLGIKPVTPGFKYFSVIPHLGRTLTWVKGDMPTPYGPVTADFNILSGIYKITVPSGTIAREIALPTGGRKVRKVMVNGKVLPEDVSHLSTGIDGVNTDSDYVRIRNVKPGIYSFRMTYSGAYRNTHPSPGKFDYQITSFTRDSLTSGHWASKYGKDGYMLLGYPPDNVSEKVPSYVDTIIFRKDKAVVWDSATSGTRAPDAPFAGKRMAAAITTQDPNATYQTMTIDIRLKKDHPCRISLYFLDWDKGDRSSAIELFDLQTLAIMAPVKMVRHYKNGKYLSFSCNRSIRIRIDQVRGENAAVSGIFFDGP
jgi:hypothetical protein